MTHKFCIDLHPINHLEVYSKFHRQHLFCWEHSNSHFHMLFSGLLSKTLCH